MSSSTTNVENGIYDVLLNPENLDQNSEIIIKLIDGANLLGVFIHNDYIKNNSQKRKNLKDEVLREKIYRISIKRLCNRVLSPIWTQKSNKSILYLKEDIIPQDFAANLQIDELHEIYVSNIEKWIKGKVGYNDIDGKLITDAMNFAWKMTQKNPIVCIRFQIYTHDKDFIWLIESLLEHGFFVDLYGLTKRQIAKEYFKIPGLQIYELSN